MAKTFTTRKHSSRMPTAGLPTVHVVVATTRCQYWGSGYTWPPPSDIPVPSLWCTHPCLLVYPPQPLVYSPLPSGIPTPHFGIPTPLSGIPIPHSGIPTPHSGIPTPTLRYTHFYTLVYPPSLLYTHPCLLVYPPLWYTCPLPSGVPTLPYGMYTYHLPLTYPPPEGTWDPGCPPIPRRDLGPGIPTYPPLPSGQADTCENITRPHLLLRVVTIEFFMISPQHKNGKIVNFVLAMPFKIKKTNKVCNLKR